VLAEDFKAGRPDGPRIGERGASRVREGAATRGEKNITTNTVAASNDRVVTMLSVLGAVIEEARHSVKRKPHMMSNGLCVVFK